LLALLQQPDQIPSLISTSSWGVQITGGSNPILRQMDSIRGLKAGFAICLQFQVRRYSMPFVAATEIWSASVAAF